MPKPVCAKCQRFYRPKHNGEAIIEQMPRTEGAQPGTGRPQDWKPYKLWMGDLWQCLGCGHELVTGFGTAPVREHFDKDFDSEVQAYEKKHGHSLIRVNDC